MSWFLNSLWIETWAMDSHQTFLLETSTSNSLHSIAIGCFLLTEFTEATAKMETLDRTALYPRRQMTSLLPSIMSEMNFRAIIDQCTVNKLVTPLPRIHQQMNFCVIIDECIRNTTLRHRSLRHANPRLWKGLTSAHASKTNVRFST